MDFGGMELFKKNKKVKIISICAAAVLTIAIFAGAASTGGEKEPEQEVKKDILVDTILPETGNIAVTGEYIGTMEPNQQVMVYPKVSAEVLAVNFNIGDTVQAGDVLFELDSKALKTTIEQSQASISKAKAQAALNLSIAQNNLDTQEYNVEYGHDNTMKNANNAVDNAKDALDAAQNRLRTAEISLSTARRQLRELNNDGIWPTSMAAMQGVIDEDQVIDQLRDAVKQAELAVQSADLGVEQAKANLEKAKDGQRTAEVMVDEQRISTNQQVKMAELNTNFSDQDIALQKLVDDLNYYSVKAPISGVIESRNVDPFDMASPQAPAFVISDKDSMTVSFKISQASYANMNTGDQVTLEKNGASYVGSITEISTMVDASGLFTVKANIPRAPADLYTGASVKIYAEAQKAENAVIVPLSAIYYDNGAPYVFVAEGGLAKKVPVETGIYDDKNIQILSGLSMSDRVISTWSSSLTDGAEIILASEAEDAALSENIESENVEEDEEDSNQ